MAREHSSPFLYLSSHARSTVPPTESLNQVRFTCNLCLTTIFSRFEPLLKCLFRRSNNTNWSYVVSHTTSWNCIYTCCSTSNCTLTSSTSTIRCWSILGLKMHRPECYCLLRHVLAVPSLSTRGIIICVCRATRLCLVSRSSYGNTWVPLHISAAVNQTVWCVK